MAKSDLLKEAIADAKAVKETALANAKIALQEAFAPRIQNMLSAKLSEDLAEQDEEELEAEPMDDMGDVGEIEPEMDDMADAGDEMGTDVGDIELDTDADGEMDFYGDIMSKEAPGEMEDEAGMEGDIDVAAEPEMSDEEADEEYMEEGDLGLDEIIAELESDMEPDPENEPVSDSPVDEGSVYEDEEELYQNESIDDIINEILAEESEEESEGEEEVVEEAQIGAESIDSDGAELNEALESLEESYKTIYHLKSVINEVNLLNAKLLYTNKLFRNFELSESQK